MDANFTDPVGFTALFSLMRKGQLALRGDCGLTVEQFRIMGLLASTSEPVAVGSVSRTLEVTKSAASMSLKDLEGRGLVERSEGSPRDRGSLSQLTAAGLRSFLEARKTVARIVDEQLNVLSPKARATLDAYIIMVATKSSAKIFVDGEFDMPLAYIEVCSKTKRILTENARKFGLSVGEYRILGELFELEEGAMPRYLSETLRVSKPQTTACCSALEGKGLAERRARPQDGRTALISITEAGRALFLGARDAYRDEFVRKIKEIDQDEAEYYLALNRKLMRRK